MTVKRHLKCKRSVGMKCVLVWLAVMTTTFHTSQAACWSDGSRYAYGDIRVLGINTTATLAGRIEICVGRDWWAVCDNGWDSDDASAVCGRLGFTESLYCTKSCFGKVSRSGGIRDFQCGNDACTTYNRATNTGFCRNDAGIACSNRMNVATPSAPTCPTTCPTTTCPTTTCPTTTCPTTICPTTTCPMTSTTTIASPTFTCSTCSTTTCPTCPTTCPTHPTHATSEATTAVDMTGSTANTSTDNLVGKKNQQSESCPSLAALGGGLGGLCAILAILLVGVVIWSYQKRGLQERPSTPQCQPEDMSLNPCYTVTTHPEATPPAIYEIIDEMKT